MPLINKDTCICIPSCRAEIQTLKNYDIPSNHHVIVVSSPERYKEHKSRYSSNPRIKVILGVVGMGAQSELCYRAAYKEGYKYFLRLDDDLRPKSFVSKNGFLGLGQVVQHCRNCLLETGTSHAGLANTSRLDWLGEGYKPTYGLIHGGVNIALACNEPNKFMDPGIKRAEDVWRTCSHRQHHLENGGGGYVGRVAFIGINKRESGTSALIDVETDSTIKLNQQEAEEEKTYILSRFSHLVSCNGTRQVGKGTILNWRFKRAKPA